MKQKIFAIFVMALAVFMIAACSPTTTEVEPETDTVVDTGQQVTVAPTAIEVAEEPATPTAARPIRPKRCPPMNQQRRPQHLLMRLPKLAMKRPQMKILKNRMNPTTRWRPKVPLSSSAEPKKEPFSMAHPRPESHSSTILTFCDRTAAPTCRE